MPLTGPRNVRGCDKTPMLTELVLGLLTGFLVVVMASVVAGQFWIERFQ